MWTCQRTAFTFIHLCGACLANRQTLSVWSRYFKEKYVRSHTDVDAHSFGQPTNNQWKACLFACAANAEQVTLWHWFAFASVSHVLFAFAYRCGRALIVLKYILPKFLYLFKYFLTISSGCIWMPRLECLSKISFYAVSF